MATQKNKQSVGAKQSPGKGKTSKTKKEAAKPPRRRIAAGEAPREKLPLLRPSGQKDDSFFEWVHAIARQIPYGRVTSYGAIAACLGTRLSARMVGWAMNAVGYAKGNIPAHRVVNRNGLLTGKHHFNPPEAMQKALEKEGIKVVEDKIVDFKKVFWDPATEL